MVQSEVVVFDRSGSENLISLIPTKSIKILDVRFETLNVFILIICIIKLKLSLLGYFVTYLNYLNPKLVITYTDNRILFYQLKNNIRNKNIKFVSVQNGCRRKFNDIFDYIPNYNNLSSDYYFVWGKNITQELSKFIQTQYIVIGSLKNNEQLIIKNKNNDKIINFISQFRKGEQFKKYGDDYYIENKLLPIIYKYCLKNNYRFNILCASNTQDEKEFYKKILDYKKEINFMEKIYPYDNYKRLDNATLNIFIDSAMGYESLARGNKTIACSLRLSKTEESFQFGWPNHNIFKQKNYVLNEINEDYIFSKINYIIKLVDKEWLFEIENFKIIMENDKDNATLSNKIRDIIS